MDEALNFAVQQPLSLTNLVVNLLIGIVLSTIVQWHFRRFGSTLSNRSELANVFPFILLTTILIISVVKSSLALSLGLVGALSIVRFRTPIKEPEELAYLFICIAIGLGLGADRTLITAVAAVIILGAMVLFKFKQGLPEEQNLYLSIELDEIGASSNKDLLKKISSHIEERFEQSDLRRFDSSAAHFQVTYFIIAEGTDTLSEVADALRAEYPGISVTFLDQNRMPSI